MERVLGTAQLDGTYGEFRDSSRESSAEEILRAAFKNGFHALDTAPAYQGAEAEIGDFGWQGRIHTKIAPGVPPLPSLKASLDALNRESVDVLYFHDPGMLNSPQREFSRIRDELPRSMANLLGVSVYTPEEMGMALEIPELEAIQIPVNVADGRFNVSLLEQAKSQGVRIYARSVFLQGLLLQEEQSLPESLTPLRGVLHEVSAVAAESRRSMAEVAIGWVRSLPGIFGIVLGAETPRQVEQLGQACDATGLSDAQLARLRNVQVTDSALLDPRRW